MPQKTTKKSKIREEIVYNFVVDFIKKHSYAPTVRDITASKEVGLKSTASAKFYLDKLEASGRISRETKKNRAFKINDVQNFLPIEVNEENTENISRIPFLGNVAAGYPLLAGVENERSICVPNDFFDVKTQSFLLQIKGDSMKDIGILDRDVVLIKVQNTALNGQIVVAQIDREEVTIKRYYNCGSYIKLHPENSDYKDIIVTPDHEFKILGIATGLMRNHIY